MKGKLALLILVVIGVTWVSLEGTSPCSVCISNLGAILFPPTPMPLPYPPPPAPEAWRTKTADERLADVRGRVLHPLRKELEARDLKLGDPAFIRAFKESRELELWLKSGQDWSLFRTYSIAALSGSIGPKLAEGDGQAPEGFYSVTADSLNPASSYHLSFNIGYPNAYDLHHQRTGSLIMIHGSNVSIGCLAMTDPVIEEIYSVVAAALQAGQKEVPVHIFPFRMTEEQMQRFGDSPHIEFWEELRAGYDWFEGRRRPPVVRVKNGHYLPEEDA